MNRRGFLAGASALLAAPTIIGVSGRAQLSVSRLILPRRFEITWAMITSDNPGSIGGIRMGDALSGPGIPPNAVVIAVSRSSGIPARMLQAPHRG